MYACRIRTRKRSPQDKTTMAPSQKGMAGALVMCRITLTSIHRKDDGRARIVKAATGDGVCVRGECEIVARVTWSASGAKSDSARLAGWSTCGGEARACSARCEWVPRHSPASCHSSICPSSRASNKVRTCRRGTHEWKRESGRRRREGWSKERLIS